MKVYREAAINERGWPGREMETHVEAYEFVLWPPDVFSARCLPDVFPSVPHGNPIGIRLRICFQLGASRCVSSSLPPDVISARCLPDVIPARCLPDVPDMIPAGYDFSCLVH